MRKQNTNNVNKTSALLQATGGKDEPDIVFMRNSKRTSQRGTQSVNTFDRIQIWTSLYADIHKNHNKTRALLQTTGGKDKQTRHEPSYKQLEVKTNKQDTSSPTNNWR